MKRSCKQVKLFQHKTVKVSNGKQTCKNMVAMESSSPVVQTEDVTLKYVELNLKRQKPEVHRD